MLASGVCQSNISAPSMATILCPLGLAVPNQIDGGVHSWRFAVETVQGLLRMGPIGLMGLICSSGDLLNANCKLLTMNTLRFHLMSGTNFCIEPGSPVLERFEIQVQCRSNIEGD